MKDYMVIHTFKSEEIRQQYFEMAQDLTLEDIRAQLKNDNASFQINWNAGEDEMAMYCWWKANSPEAKWVRCFTTTLRKCLTWSM